jgi:hypothetical protein
VSGTFEAVAFDVDAFDTSEPVIPVVSSGGGFVQRRYAVPLPADEEEEEFVMLWREWVNYG